MFDGLVILAGAVYVLLFGSVVTTCLLIARARRVEISAQARRSIAKLFFVFCATVLAASSGVHYILSDPFSLDPRGGFLLMLVHVPMVPGLACLGYAFKVLAPSGISFQNMARASFYMSIFGIFFVLLLGFLGLWGRIEERRSGSETQVEAGYENGRLAVFEQWE